MHAQLRVDQRKRKAARRDDRLASAGVIVHPAHLVADKRQPSLAHIGDSHMPPGVLESYLKINNSLYQISTIAHAEHKHIIRARCDDK